MTDDDRPTPQLPRLPYSKQLAPEDLEVEQLPKQYQGSDPRLYGEDYGPRYTNR